MKSADVIVYNYLESISDGSVKGGVALAPFRDWDSKVPADLKARLQQASHGIKDGSIKTDLP